MKKQCIFLPPLFFSCLKGKDLILELADGTSLLEAEAFGGLLQTANHGRRTAEQDLDVVGGLGEVFLIPMLVFQREKKCVLGL